jgi:hypothetical protein
MGGLPIGRMRIRQAWPQGRRQAVPVNVADLLQAISQVNPGILAGVAIIVLLALASVARVLAVLVRLRRESRPGRQASASTNLPAGTLPLTSFNRKGHTGDPLNAQLTGTAGQVAAAFAAAGWYRADEIDLVTSVRISVDSVLARKYSTAPVSNLYLYGRKEDLAFERPGRSVRERDHVRLWDTGLRAPAPGGRPIWIAGATRDIRVVLAKTNHMPTHQIAPDVDSERELLASELIETGWVVDDTWRPGFGKPTQEVNGTGDPYYTDGQVIVLTLANVFAPPALLQVRGKTGGRVARTLARLVRWRLPKRGRERAQHERERRARHGHEAGGVTPAGGTGPGAGAGAGQIGQP